MSQANPELTQEARGDAPTSTILAEMSRRTGRDINPNLELHLDTHDVVPEQGDNLSDLLEKLTLVTNVIEKGGSVAVALGQEVRGAKGVTAEDSAIARMGSEERLLYDIWKKGHKLPELDLAAHRTPVRFGGQPAKRYERNLAAFSRMYNVPLNRVLMEHVSYFMHTHHPLVPLLTALSKLVAAEKDFNRSDFESGLQRAEYEVTNRLNSDYARAIQVIQEEYNAIKRVLDNKLQVLNSRRSMVAPGQSKAAAIRTTMQRTRDKANLPRLGEMQGFNRQGATGRVPRKQRPVAQGDGASTGLDATRNPYASLAPPPEQSSFAGIGPPSPVYVPISPSLEPVPEDPLPPSKGKGRAIKRPRQEGEGPSATPGRTTRSGLRAASQPVSEEA